MWNSVVEKALEIFSSILGMFQKKQEIRQEEQKEKQSAENVKKAEIIREVEIKDRTEELIKNIKDAESPEQRQKWLDELRKRVSS